MATETPNLWPRDLGEFHIRHLYWQHLGRLPTQDELNLNLLGWYGGYGVPNTSRGPIAVQDGIAGSPEAFTYRNRVTTLVTNSVGEPSGIWADVQAIKAWIDAHP